MGLTTIEKGHIEWLGSGYRITDTTALLYQRGQIAVTATGKPFVFHGYPAAIRRHLEKRAYTRIIAARSPQGTQGHLTIRVAAEAAKFRDVYLKEVFMGFVGPLGAVSKVAAIAPAAVMSVDTALAAYDALGPQVDRVSNKPSKAKTAWQKINPGQSKVFVMLDWSTPPGKDGVSLRATDARPLYFHELSQVLGLHFGL